MLPANLPSKTSLAGKFFSCGSPLLAISPVLLSVNLTLLHEKHPNEIIAVPPLYPAAIASQLMNVGLLYTPVSIYQMTRGSLVLFVGTFSVIFLRRRLWLYQFSISDLLSNLVP